MKLLILFFLISIFIITPVLIGIYWEGFSTWVTWFFSSSLPENVDKDPLLTAMLIFSLSLCSLLLGGGIIFYSWKYKKENKNVFSINKITIFSFFFSFFLFQSFLTSFSDFNTVIPFSLDTITIIAVGFIFGPLEGILYGFVADFSRVLINGWVFQLIPMFMFPLLGLMSGMFGRLFLLNSKQWSTQKNIAINQIVIVSFVALGAVSAPLLINNFGYETNNAVYWWLTLGFSIFSLFLMELVFIWALRSREKNDLYLFALIAIINAIDRLFNGYFLRSLSNWMYWGIPFEREVLIRMVTGSYLVPMRTITSFILIKYSLFAIEQTGTLKNWNQ